MSEKQNTCCKERPENTLSVDDFPSSKEDSFPSLLLPECHTAGMRLLGGRDSVAMTPEALCPGRAPTLTGKSKQLPSESALHIKWPKYWTFRFSISPSNEYSGLISFRMDGLVSSPCNPRDSQDSPAAHFKSISSNKQTNKQKSISSLALSLLYDPALSSVHTTGKTIALAMRTLVSRVISLLFNMLSRFVITLLPS